MRSQPGTTVESHREGPIHSGRVVGKGVQRLDLKQDKKLRKEGVGASIPSRGWCLEALPALAVCSRAVVPMDSRGLSKHDCEPQVQIHSCPGTRQEAEGCKAHLSPSLYPAN